ncbi:MAG: methylenetetrahydrofolate reductase [Actinomycetota bacterium]
MTFRLILEIEPPRAPDLSKVARQLDIFGPLVDAILVPDNHLARPAVSSVALAVEIRRAGFQAIPAVNARDRNHLRLRSDLMTLQAYGVEEVLFLYGDRIAHGRSALTVREMLGDEAGAGLRRGVVATIGRPLAWRRRADFLVTKLAFGRSKAGYWREAEGFAHSLYCGVIALPDGEMARRVVENIPDLEPPPGYIDAFDTDPDAGFHAAIAELDELHAAGIDGAHLVVPAGRRRFAEMLEAWIASKRSRSGEAARLAR